MCQGDEDFLARAAPGGIHRRAHSTERPAGPSRAARVPRGSSRGSSAAARPCPALPALPLTLSPSMGPGGRVRRGPRSGAAAGPPRQPGPAAARRAMDAAAPPAGPRAGGRLYCSGVSGWPRTGQSWAAAGTALPASQGADPAPLSALPRDICSLCPVLGSSVQERRGAWSRSSRGPWRSISPWRKC